ncbi:MAG: hypothetical protein KC589_05750 [Nanoarchaeota archaeon]|nr:hypothetical protein [Nanoarchaeota archaeon]MCA9496421.1 hypothetical protein [Nanoarchaeota archaeon]
MSNFKRVLEVEKKYDSLVNKAKNNFENELENYKLELLKREEEFKKEFKKELDERFRLEIEETKVAGNRIVEDALLDAENLEKTANVEKASNYLFEEIKNV